MLNETVSGSISEPISALARLSCASRTQGVRGRKEGTEEVMGED